VNYFVTLHNEKGTGAFN